MATYYGRHSVNDGKSPVSDVYGSGETAVIPEFLDADHRLPSGDVDWVDEIMQKAMVQSYNLSLAKADKVSSHLFSLGYFNQDGLMKYTGFERISGRFNNEFKLFNDRLKSVRTPHYHMRGEPRSPITPHWEVCYTTPIRPYPLPLFTIWTGISAATRSPTSPTR